MGVNCIITLPNNARLRDVANAMGTLAGLPTHLEPLGEDSVHVVVNGVKTSPCGEGLEACAYIDLTKAGKRIAHVMYHFEFDTGKGDVKDSCRGMIPDSTPFWCAMGRRLVEVFGGTYESQDCGRGIEAYASQKKNRLNGAVDGEEWNHHMRRLAAIKPITEAEIKACEGKRQRTNEKF